MRVLVVTVVHTPLDARIHHRQVRALVEHGCAVTYAAPWTATSTPAGSCVASVRTVDLPRARGRRRLTALWSARRLLRQYGRHHDVILLHDPELVLALVGQRRRLPPVVLDVHEDTAAALVDRPWVPGAARPALRWLIALVERWADRHLHLLLAEASYAARFRHPHPIVPNVPPRPTHQPPPPGSSRVVYLGRIARSRGAEELLDIAARIHPRFQVELIGEADPDIEGAVRQGVAAGHLSWAGFLPNAEALDRLEGALAGLSLVHPQPNHAGSLQTKVLEYLARRVPVISSELPVTGPFIRRHAIGITVEPGDVPGVISAIEYLAEHEEERTDMADRGLALVRDELNWDIVGERFVSYLRAACKEVV